MHVHVCVLHIPHDPQHVSSKNLICVYALPCGVTDAFILHCGLKLHLGTSPYNKLRYACVKTNRHAAVNSVADGSSLYLSRLRNRGKVANMLSPAQE